MAFIRAALALVLLLTMLGSAAGCGRKAMPEPRKSERSSTATLIGAR
jgi:predicted small lipoprotein YifL